MAARRIRSNAREIVVKVRFRDDEFATLNRAAKALKVPRAALIRDVIMAKVEQVNSRCESSSAVA